MQYQFQPFEYDRVRLAPGMFQQRFNLNRKYMMSLSNENLLQNFYLEAGLWSPPQKTSGLSLGLGVADQPGARTLPRPLAFRRSDDLGRN